MSDDYQYQIDLTPIVAGKRVAIVGHASSLLNGRYGVEIDSADVVVRFHTCQPPPGSEASMGTSTELWYCGKITACPRHAEIVDGKLDGVPICGKKPDLLHYIRRHWNPMMPRRYNGIPAPNTWSCTGIVAAIDCLLSKAESVWLYGFDFFASADIHSGETVTNRPHLAKPVIARSLHNDKRRLRAMLLDGGRVRYDKILRDIVIKEENKLPEGPK